jgi:anti-sigma B factor antagonist
VELSISTREGCTVIGLLGEIDLGSSSQLREGLQSVTEQGSPRVVVDVGDVSLMDSSAIGVLVFALNRLSQRGGWLRLARVPPVVCRSLEVLALTDILPAFESVEAAIAHPPSGD